MPGHWAVAELRGLLHTELLRKEEKPSGFRKSLVCNLGSWGSGQSRQGQMAQKCPAGISWAGRQAAGLLQGYP